jgi:hypothetical protein
MGMKWIALIGQNVMRKGKKIRVEAGEDCPEAEFFPQRDEVWVKNGFIKQVFCADLPVKDEEPKPKRTRRTPAQMAEARALEEAKKASPVLGSTVEVR